MSYTVVTAKIDPQTKREAMKTAAELGMPLSVVIKAFLKQFIRTKSLTVSTLNEVPNDYLRMVIRIAEENLKAGKHSPIFRSGKEAVAYLNKQGI